MDVHAYYRQVTDVDIGEIARELLGGRVIQEIAPDAFLRLPESPEPIAPFTAHHGSTSRAGIATAVA